MEIFSVFGQVFEFLGSFMILGVPYIYLIIGTALIGIIMNFVKGERK